MGRTKSQPVELVEDAPLTDGLSVNLNAMSEHRLEIMQQFGDGLPYERDRIVHETRFYMAQSAEAMLEAGKRLVILKENEPHGDFIDIVESQLSLSKRTAQVMMQASLKYLSPKLEPKAQALALLGKTKLFELMTEDDEDLVELADGGTIAGMSLDDIDRMTSRELKAALREARETNAAQQRVLADKNEKIDSLSTKLEKKSRIQPPKPDEEVKKLRAEVTALAVEAESAIAVRLSSAFETLCAYCAENMIDTPRDFMAGLVCQLESTARSLRSTFDLPDEPTGNAAPSWLTDPTPQINGQEA
ncbi:DUF3102 domain-containing protein [Salmonella enterica subsp. enterica serovar Poona]|uniref:DUF3102 domain-containing protein n=1 Tax=Pantoea stewartii subsp. stewartii DC283 TaxID=660596 RepID=H3RB80_PANSE|nr:DUF3102 domain-containing protein [Pantoea stewartii]EAM3231542.1 DUF3102 domain-containing protein [Salmonella enterica]EBH8909604.1 DUF3102 domain-containing protein [Salmonella enterica subsp. enterica serovar Santiago]EBS2935214.1 DUF3102 domain-containing protein [Salmonella enterica subsp. enterica serovar Poona]ECH9067240.1 DUF3102 domain-containing protein [Salmonella enterica subsp. enterica]ARF49472.1 DUF3102 domain-containing protein [Pantoea stewartii subsp. stewartii DC283]